MSADSHCHLNDPAFGEDRSEAAQRARDAGVGPILNIGYDPATSEAAIELAERHGDMYASVGLHPHHASMMSPQLAAEMENMVAHKKVVAIGETGLDYYRDRSPRDKQAESFKIQLALARKVDKPIVIHCRDAMEDCLALLRDEGIPKAGGVMHCFAGTEADAKAAMDIGLYISFAGNITYPKAQNLRDVIKTIPAHRILLETDAPYLSPQKKRGKRNEPAYLPMIVAMAAEARGVTEEDMGRVSVSNFNTLFLRGATASQGEITYKIRDSLYINVTRECTNECGFCVRFFSDTLQGHNLRIDHDPTAEEMIAGIGDPADHSEIVFCGYGEPTLRLDRIKEVARWVKERGGRTRLDTNGHGSHIAGHDIAPELVGLIDVVSVSLNAQDAGTYDEICLPLIPDAWIKVIAFIKSARDSGLDVTASVVPVPEKVDVEACRKLVEGDLGVKFRVRAYNLPG
ncbi:MAG: YchF/TatD family DNA exonuclease [Nitrospinota bacterium]|nr:YchF/TatD family DNA exonuclease [Nitrospinota bacterium]